MAADFHEIRFPTDIALGTRGGPRRLTEIVTLASGREHRNSRWAQSRRRYDAGLGIRTLDALHAVLEFFEERRGRLYGFRFHDRIDGKSCAPSFAPSAGDQPIGTGDGTNALFQLRKLYGGAHAPYERVIRKPVAGSVKVAVDGVARILGSQVECDLSTGILTFQPGYVPGPGAAVTAGFSFDVPVRFDADELDIDLSAFAAGEVPKIPLIEIFPSGD